MKTESPSGEVESPNERRERSRSSLENGQVESSDGGYIGAEEVGMVKLVSCLFI